MHVRKARVGVPCFVGKMVALGQEGTARVMRCMWWWDEVVRNK
jgi:hypothetical protein